MRAKWNAVSNLCLALSVALSLPSSAQKPAQTSPEQAAQAIVDKNFPRELIDSKSPRDRRSCSAIYDFEQDGSPRTIFAVYPQLVAGIPGEMFVLQKNEAGQFKARKIGPPKFDFAGRRCMISLVSVDGSDKNQIEVSVWGMDQVSGDFLFRWNGNLLTSFAPTGEFLNQKWENPAFGSASFLHLYDDGTLAAVSIEDDPDSDRRAIYRLQGQEYKLAGQAAYIHSFQCSSNPCGDEDKIFTVDVGDPGPFVLRIGNGDLKGKLRASKVSVSINGVDVVPSGAINEQVESMTFPLSNVHTGENTIKVTLQGNADSKIDVAIEDHGPE